MKPLELLQLQIAMYQISRSLGIQNPYDFSALQSEVKSFHIRFKRIRNSLKYYDKSLFADYEYSVKRMAIAEKQYTEFIDKINHNLLVTIKNAIDSSKPTLVTDVKEFIVLCQELEENLNEFESFEREVKNLCMKDWYQHLTSFRPSISEIQILDKYAFIIQALDHFNPFINPHHPGFSASVITESHLYIHNNRKVGFIYLPKAHNVKLMTATDSNTKIQSVVDPKSILNTIFAYSYVDTNIELMSNAAGDEYDDGYFPFNVFMLNCTQLRCNELVLAYPIEPVGTFFRYDAEKQDKDMAIRLASYCGVPLVKLMLDGHAMLMNNATKFIETIF